jgi:hypothetical protein
MFKGTDCTGSCKSNYHTITTTTAPRDKELRMSTCDLLTDKGILSIDMTYMYVVVHIWHPMQCLHIGHCTDNKYGRVNGEYVSLVYCIFNN